MRKILLANIGLLAFALSVAGLAPAANADQTQLKLSPYVGFDLQRTHVSYEDDADDIVSDGLNGINVHIGNRFTRYFGAELGYFRTGNESKNFTVGAVTGDSKLRLEGITLDGLGYLPLDDAQKFDLIGTAGLAWTKAHYDLTAAVPGFQSGSVSGNESEIGIRAGVGAQVHLTDRVSARALARYQTADFDNIASHIMTYSLGLNYSF